jgi:hypothetical protein
MMPVKWKLFKIMLVVLLVMYIPVILIDLYSISNMTARVIKRPQFITGQAILLLLSVIICGNVLFAFKKLHAFFGNTALQVTNRAGSIVTLVLFSISMLIFSLVFCIGFYDEYLKPRNFEPGPDQFYSRLALLYLFMVVTIGIYISIMQVKLFRLLSKRKKENLNNIIEAIGCV